MEIRKDLRRKIGFRLFPQDGKAFTISTVKFQLFMVNADNTKAQIGVDTPVTPSPVSKRESLRSIPGYELVTIVGPLLVGTYKARFVYTIDGEDEDFYIDIYVIDI